MDTFLGANHAKNCIFVLPSWEFAVWLVPSIVIKIMHGVLVNVTSQVYIKLDQVFRLDLQ
jgi:hypothetical protein